jgi:hypothetical protein
MSIALSFRRRHRQQRPVHSTLAVLASLDDVARRRELARLANVDKGAHTRNAKLARSYCMHLW